MNGERKVLDQVTENKENLTDDVAPIVADHDPVASPAHYRQHPSGIECIDITKHMSFTVGNAIKYLWRAGLKQDPGKDQLDKRIEDLQKAIQYIKFEIERLKSK